MEGYEIWFFSHETIVWTIWFEKNPTENHFLGVSETFISSQLESTQYGTYANISIGMIRIDGRLNLSVLPIEQKNPRNSHVANLIVQHFPWTKKNLCSSRETQYWGCYKEQWLLSNCRYWFISALCVKDYVETWYLRR